MGSRMWTRLVMGVGAAIVAVATGTAVIAAIDDQDDPPASRQAAGTCLEGATDCVDTFDGDAAGGTCLVGTPDCNDTPGTGGAVAAMCAPDHPDCDDMIVVGEDGFAQCATEEPCGDFDTRCAADTACIEPGFYPYPSCPEGLSYEECFPDGTPEGWDCVQLESFPEQIKCYPIGCTPVDGPITILPAPDEPVIIEEPTLAPTDPSTVDPGIAVGEPVPPTIIECIPPIDCSEEPASAVHCLPVEPCVPADDVACAEPCQVFEDGSIACPVPPVECQTKEECLPPDCAISSDGTIYCPEPMPLPCPEVEGADGGCSSPGSCGDLGCESIVCPDGVTDEECKRLLEEMQSGGGTSGSGGSTEAIP